MRGTATKFDVKDGDYGFYALGTFKDELGSEEKMFFAVKKGDTLVDVATAMQLCLWGIKYDANTDNYKAYFNNLVAKQLQDNPQSPPQSTQATNPPEQGDYDIGIRTALVCAYISGGAHPLIEDVEYWMAYIKTGKDASLPGNVNTEHHTDDNPPQTDQDGIPF